MSSQHDGGLPPSDRQSRNSKAGVTLDLQQGTCLQGPWHRSSKDPHRITRLQQGMCLQAPWYLLSQDLHQITGLRLLLHRRRLLMPSYPR
ncbi:unnamed protein product [Lota lota]